MQARASLKNLEEAPPHLSALGADLYLKHVRDTQRQMDEVLEQRPGVPQGRARCAGSRKLNKDSARASTTVREEQSARTGLLR